MPPNPLTAPPAHDATLRGEPVARAVFTGLPARYDRLAYLLSFGQDRRWRRAVTDHAATVTPRLTLDVATGPAGVALAVAARTGADVVGVDLNEPMLRAGLPAEERMRRLSRTADELAAAIRGRDDAALSRRPDAKNWAAKEAICHLRDVEEMFTGRFGMILAMDNPKLAFDPTTPDRWAEDRQYLRNDAQLALAAFRARRDEALALLRTLTPEQWKRAGIHATRGPITINDFVTLMAWHDDNHLDQLKRALEGQA